MRLVSILPSIAFRLRLLPILPVLLITLVGCFQSHDRGEVQDAGRPDIRRLDAASPQDVSIPSCSFERVAQHTLDWPAIDCGSAKQPRIVAAGGLYRVLTNEERACDDRPSFLWSRDVRPENNVLVIGEGASIGTSFGRPYAAGRRSAEVGICSNEQLIIQGPGGDVRMEPLRPPPMQFPGCSQFLSCGGLVFDGTRWVAAWERFECDVTLHEITRGPLAEQPFAHRFPVVSTVGTPGASAALSLDFDRNGGELILWDADQPEPRVVSYEGAAGGSGLVRWPFLDAVYALAIAVDLDLEIRWLTAGGEEIRRRRYEGVLPAGSMAIELRLAAAEFGIVVVGSRREGLHSVTAIDQNGVLLHSSELTSSPRPAFSMADVTADVAAMGNSVVVHLLGPTPPSEWEQTQIMHYRCD